MDQKRKKGKLGRIKSKGKTRTYEKHNYQDAAMEREYNKGRNSEKEAENMSRKFPVSKVIPKTNDPQWYFKNSQILKDVASFSFNAPLGADMRMMHYMGTDVTGGVDAIVCDTATSIPGLMTYHIAPIPGVAVDAQSPVNLAATNVYSYVRYKNSGATNYDAPDLMLYLLAMDSVYACWNWMKRIYGFASTYSQLNRYQPAAYVYSNGVDFDDLMANLANFRAYLNLTAERISAFCVPATMTYNIRHSWLFSNIYKDSDTSKAQQYMFVPSMFYQYDETSSPRGGILKPIPILLNFNPSVQAETGPANVTLYKVTDLMGIMNSMINALQYSEDAGVMSGDILKAYGEGGLFKLSTFDPDYKVEPVYSKEVLSQFENADVGVGVNLTDWTIRQDPDTNFITFQPISTSLIEHQVNFLNFHWENPTPEDVIRASRLMITTVPNASGNGTKVVSCGSEVVTSGYMYTMTTQRGAIYTPYVGPNASLKLTAYSLLVEEPVLEYNQAGTAAATQQAYMRQLLLYVNQLIMRTAFDWCPKKNVLLGSKSTTTDTRYNYLGTMWDWDNYVMIEAANIFAMNEMALLTEFNVPN